MFCESWRKSRSVRQEEWLLAFTLRFLQVPDDGRPPVEIVSQAGAHPRRVLSLVMPRGTVTRSLSASFAICFAFVTVLPAFSDPCPFHDPALAELAATSASDLGHQGASMVGMVHHSSATGQERGGNHGTHSQHQKSHRCNCVSCATGAPAFTLPAQPLSFAPAAISAGSRTPPPPSDTHARSRAEHALPFSTAPPLPSSDPSPA